MIGLELLFIIHETWSDNVAWTINDVFSVSVSVHGFCPVQYGTFKKFDWIIRHVNRRLFIIFARFDVIVVTGNVTTHCDDHFSG